MQHFPYLDQDFKKKMVPAAKSVWGQKNKGSSERGADVLPQAVRSDPGPRRRSVTCHRHVLILWHLL